MAALGVWDYIIVFAVLFCSAAIGIYYRFSGGKQKTSREYMLADRSMSVVPVAFSLMTTYMSAITLLGVCAENYQYGTMFSIIDLSYVLGTPICVHLIVPVFFHLKTASVYEYLEQRFGYATRICASLAYTIEIVMYMGIALIAPALTLEAVTGMDQHFSVIAIGVVCTFYATIGGMKAVLSTDIFQSLLMFVSIYSVIICAAIKLGGLSEIWQLAQAGGRINFSVISIDPTVRHTWWTQIFGGFVIYVTMFGINQAQVQRMLSAKNLKTAQASLWWCLPILMLLSLSTCFAGLSIYAYYRDCDPLVEGRITARDQLMPLFVVDTMSHIPGLCGLYIAGIFSASLSTISGAISSLATITLEDYLKPLLFQRSGIELNENKTTLLLKFLNLFFGALCIGMAYLSGLIGGLLQAALSIFGIIGGPLMGLFTAGVCTTRANQKGIITGFLIGLSLCLWIGFGTPKPIPQVLSMSDLNCPSSAATTSITDFLTTTTAATVSAVEVEQQYFYLYRISYMWYPVIGFLVTFLVGLSASLVCEALRWDLNTAIYNDVDRTNIKCELFMPPIANYLRRKQTPLVDNTSRNLEKVY